MQGVVAACGKVSRGGAADGGSEAAQLAIVADKAIGASRIQRNRGVMGAPGLGRGDGGGPLDRQGLLMMVFKAAVLFGPAFAFKAPRDGVRHRGGGVRLGGSQSSPGQVERIPAKAQSMPKNDGRADERYGQQTPAGWSQHPQQRPRPHGNTLRSSSKCGPSRSLGQSPPQTMAVPWRTAAALKAAAMRG